MIFRVQTADFDVSAELAAMRQASTAMGAITSFVGVVRDDGRGVGGLELEHYPGMTERSIHAMIDAAFQRFDMLGATIIHRVGALAAGDQIVLVAVCSAHRGESFKACEFLMDFLKTEAPFWKKEHVLANDQVLQSRWVDARDSDGHAMSRWRTPPDAP